MVAYPASRPSCITQVIADELLKAAEQIEASYKDPYDDPSYAVQLAKVEAKAAREAARAEAAAAKVARWVMSTLRLQLAACRRVMLGCLILNIRVCFCTAQTCNAMQQSIQSPSR